MAAAMALSIYLDQEDRKTIKAAGLGFFLDLEAHKSFLTCATNQELAEDCCSQQRRLTQAYLYVGGAT